MNFRGDFSLLYTRRSLHVIIIVRLLFDDQVQGSRIYNIIIAHLSISLSLLSFKFWHENYQAWRIFLSFLITILVMR